MEVRTQTRFLEDTINKAPPASAPTIHDVMSFSQQPYEIGPVISPISEARNGTQFTKGHRASKAESGL